MSGPAVGAGSHLRRIDFPLALRFPSFVAGDMSTADLLRLALRWARANTPPTNKQGVRGRKLDPREREYFRLHGVRAGSVHAPRNSFAVFFEGPSGPCVYRSPERGVVVVVPGFHFAWMDRAPTLAEQREHLARMVGHLLLGHVAEVRPAHTPPVSDDPGMVAQARLFAALAIGGEPSDPGELALEVLARGALPCVAEPLGLHYLMASCPPGTPARQVMLEAYADRAWAVKRIRERFAADANGGAS